MSVGQRAVAAARGCIGIRFRPQGRDPAFGLDCVGLIAVALHAAGHRGTAPSGYALRGGQAATWAAMVDAAGLRRVDDVAAGDVLLFESGAEQFHLGVWTGTGLIHADAMLRRVSERPGVPPWPVVGVWRLAETEGG